MSKIIELTKGCVAIVDDEDYDWLTRHSWYTNTSNPRIYYAESRVKGEIIGMHRAILFHHKLLTDSLIVDHIDGDGLNNQKRNLRACTQAENGRNRKGPFKNGYIGIYRRKNLKNPWVANIKVDRKKIHLGVFPTREEAARAYDQAARKHHGEFATLNFPHERVD